MSHVATVDIEIKDLHALAKACHKCGLELIRDQATYKWFGESVGDYPLPPGFIAEDLGKCSHAIRVPDNDRAYEIGVVQRRDGRPGFMLMWDFYDGGKGMQQKAGAGCNVLKREYATAVATKQAQLNGFRVTEQRQPNGSIKLVCSK